MHILNDRYVDPKKINASALPKELAARLGDLYQRFYNEALHEFDYLACEHSQEFARYLQTVEGLTVFHPKQLTDHNTRLAFWLNLYNGLAIHDIIHNNIGDSINSCKAFFTKNGYQLAEGVYSLDDIEHGILRNNHPKYASLLLPLSKDHPGRKHCLPDIDPRIHAALFCGTRSCPDLRVFHPDTIDAELDAITRLYLANNVFFEPDTATLNLPQKFHWYRDDFGSKKQMLALICKNHSKPEVRYGIQETSDKLKIHHINHDWRLNQSSSLL